jgi:hypothetical protein
VQRENEDRIGVDVALNLCGEAYQTERRGVDEDAGKRSVGLTEITLHTIRRGETQAQRYLDTDPTHLQRQPRKRISKAFPHGRCGVPFSLNHKINSSEKLELLHNFVACLAIVLADDQAMLATYISSDLLEESKFADGHAFGKPVWDFQYPDSSNFVTKSNFVGCAIATTQPGDEVFVSLDSTYPMVLRPKDTGDSRIYVIRGFAYVDGVMDRERAGSNSMIFQIQ